MNFAEQLRFEHQQKMKKRNCQHKRWRTKHKQFGIRKVVKCRGCGILKNLITGELIEEAIVEK